MKKIIWFTAVPLFVVSIHVAQAVAPPEPNGPANFNVTAFAQDLSYAVTSSKTNHSSTTTNTTTVYKSSETNIVVNSAYVLGLLANSFNTNFPDGAKLVMVGAGDYTFYVTDKSGIVILPRSTVDSVLSIALVASVNTGSETATISVTTNSSSLSGNDSETFLESVVLTYDDTALATSDGTHTKFHLSGVLTEKLSRNLGTDKATESVSLTGGGDGTIRNKEVVLKGTVSGNLVGFILLV
jgi:hypothetical protein